MRDHKGPAEANQPPNDQEAPLPSDETALWRSDTGTLHDLSRRALLRLLKGPYLSGAKQTQLWSALLADERAIRSRLHDLFLDLVIDRDDELAFVRKVQTDEIDIPTPLRNESLTFIETAMLLTLRQMLLANSSERRVIVGKEEIYEQLQVYNEGDTATFERNLNSAWGRMENRYRVLHSAGDDRVEISPIVKFLIDPDRVRELTNTYLTLATGQQADTGEAR